MSLQRGTPAPLFHARSHINPNFAFSSLGGHYVLLAFLPGPGPERQAALALVLEHRALFANGDILFFAVLPDLGSSDDAPRDLPVRWFADPKGEIRSLFNAVTPDGALDPQWVVVDPGLRILGSTPLANGPNLLRNMGKLPRPDDHAGVPLTAPVLIVPRILEPDFCRRLIDHFKETGGEPSGVMVARGGKTVGVLDDFKKRRDASISDAGLQNALRSQLYHRLVPEIAKAFQFTATRIERDIVACYDARDGGYFRRHRDNGTPGTAHRRFAVSINLNAEDFEGGDLRFPEFGSRTYRPPTGGAVVFSCSLLHEATPVTQGTRYATLPFLYDEAGEQLRAANYLTFVEDPGPAGEAALEPAG